jgi:hypothetical protein
VATDRQHQGPAEHHGRFVAHVGDRWEGGLEGTLCLSGEGDVGLLARSEPRLEVSGREGLQILSLRRPAAGSRSCGTPRDASHSK